MYVMTSPAGNRTMDDDPRDDVFETDSDTRHDRKGTTMSDGTYQQSQTSGSYET